MTLPTDTWPAVTWLWLIEGAAFFVLLHWSWQRNVPGARAFRGLVFGSMLYVTTEALSLTVDSPTIRYWLSGISFGGIGLIGPNLVVLFADITGRNQWLTKGRRTLLYVFGIGLGLARFCDPLWGLMYRSEVLVHDQGLVLSKFEPGVFYHVLTALLISAMLLGFFNIAMVWRDASQLMRRHLTALGISCMLPVAASAFFNIGFHPAGWLDPTPFSLIGTVGLTTWAISYDRLVEVVPIARNYLVDLFNEGVLVVDTSLTVIDTNPALRRMLDLPEKETLGQPVSVVVKRWPALLEICTRTEATQLELQPEIRSEIFWQASWHPLTSPADPKPQGFLLVLTDISARKQTEMQLHDLVAERTKEWRRATSTTLRTADEEKRKVGLTLRESICPQLTQAAKNAEALTTSPSSEFDPGQRTNKLSELARQITAINHQVQDFAILFEGPDLNHQTFREALNVVIANLQETFKLNCQLNIAPDFPASSRERSRHFIAIMREAIVNAVRHAKARNITIDFVHRTDGDTVTVSNDGTPLPERDQLIEGPGIRQMRMRTALLNGRISFRPGPSNGGAVELFAPPQTAETAPGFFQI